MDQRGIRCGRGTCRWVWVVCGWCVWLTPAVAQGSAVVLETSSGSLHGTLVSPAEAETVVLIVPGSGPTDRDGNNALGGAMRLQSDAYRQLAEALAQAGSGPGVATLRYDKRGIGQSAAAGQDESAMRFEHGIEDAAGWLAWLHDAGYARVMVLGHSEGALIGLEAAAQAREAGLRVDGVVLACPQALNASETLRRQLRPQLPDDWWTQADAALGRLEAGETVQLAELPPVLWSLFRPSVQPYLSSWFRYTPATSLAAWGGPTLIVGGTTDAQVAFADVAALASGQHEAGLVLLAGVNHLMKDVTGDLATQLPSYRDPSIPLSPRLLRVVRRFVER